MIITILTLFPEFFHPIFSNSIIGNAVKKGIVRFNTVNIRDFASDKRKTIDDRPYGGGKGMILRCDIIKKAIDAVRTGNKGEKTVLLEPTGRIFTQKSANEYSVLKHLILVCGHYEGTDYRVNYFVDETISVGNYILTGGEIPAMAVSDATVRLLPGVLPEGAVSSESFSENYHLEPPQFTRPPEFLGKRVPQILLSGNHREINEWKKKKSGLMKRGRKTDL